LLLHNRLYQQSVVLDQEALLAWEDEEASVGVGEQQWRTAGGGVVPSTIIEIIDVAPTAGADATRQPASEVAESPVGEEFGAADMLHRSSLADETSSAAGPPAANPNSFTSGVASAARQQLHRHRNSGRPSVGDEQSVLFLDRQEPDWLSDMKNPDALPMLFPHLFPYGAGGRGGEGRTVPIGLAAQVRRYLLLGGSK
jgi:hypothetical protein